MKLNLISIGTRLPDWVNTGLTTYLKRLPPDISAKLIEIPAVKRHKATDLAKAMATEGERLLAVIPKNNEIIILERTGEHIDTLALADKLTQWHSESRDISLLIGGPEGLPDNILAKANWLWSLSPLTLPHPLARILVAEQIYRAWSIMTHHPYHR